MHIQKLEKNTFKIWLINFYKKYGIKSLDDPKWDSIPRRREEYQAIFKLATDNIPESERGEIYGS